MSLSSQPAQNCLDWLLAPASCTLMLKVSSVSSVHLCIGSPLPLLPGTSASVAPCPSFQESHIPSLFFQNHCDVWHGQSTRECKKQNTGERKTGQVKHLLTKHTWVLIDIVIDNRNQHLDTQGIPISTPLPPENLARCRC
ncbi:hypothetical protein BsWGS_10111 [Bradybaena similaris]